MSFNANEIVLMWMIDLFHQFMKSILRAFSNQFHESIYIVYVSPKSCYLLKINEEKMLTHKNGIKTYGNDHISLNKSNWQ